MKRNLVQPLLYSLPLLLCMPMAQAYVYLAGDEPENYKQKTENNTQEMVTVPVFEGGITASIGTIYVVPTSDDQSFGLEENSSVDAISVVNFDPDYEFGIDASLGYLLPDTANAIEFYYREVSTNDHLTHDDITVVGAPESVKGTLSYDLNAYDLMISQFIDVGDYMQMRFAGGASYLDLTQHIKYVTTPDDAEFEKNNSDYSGWGLRVAIDSRYDFGQGFGIVGGGSLGYYLGTLDVSSLLATEVTVEDNRDNHAVASLRANLGIDYVFFDNQDDTNLGIELGYLFDYYDNAAGDITATKGSAETFAVSFNGPYLNLKGVF